MSQKIAIYCVWINALFFEFHVLPKASFFSADLKPPYFLESTVRAGYCKLVFMGCDYTKKYVAAKTVKWVCASKYLTQCKARVIMNKKDGTVKVDHEQHNHPLLSIERITANYESTPVTFETIQRICYRKKR